MRKCLSFVVLPVLIHAAAAQAQAFVEPPRNVLQLQASGNVEVPQDMLVMTLSVSREAPDAATVQQQLTAVLQPALAEARRNAQPGQLDVRTGAFSVLPRQGRDGKIQAWFGTAELVLEGRDLARIAQLGGRLPGMSIAGVAFGLSREAQQRAQGEAQQQAVDAFRARADALTRAFGFSGYTLREVSVQTSDFGTPRPRMMALESRAAAADAPIPVEAGRSLVTVQVSGSVQMGR